MKGSCLCGQVQYRIDGIIRGIIYCHCGQCRKASGSAFATNAAVPAYAFKIVTGSHTIKSFESSPGKKRWFCGHCGSPIYSQSVETFATVYVRIGTLDDDPKRKPDIHIHTASKAPWYEITDNLPKQKAEEDLPF
jgi:hypothetical protein